VANNWSKTLKNQAADKAIGAAASFYHTLGRMNWAVTGAKSDEFYKIFNDVHSKRSEMSVSLIGLKRYHKSVQDAFCDNEHKKLDLIKAKADKVLKVDSTTGEKQELKNMVIDLANAAKSRIDYIEKISANRKLRLFPIRR